MLFLSLWFSALPPGSSALNSMSFLSTILPQHPACNPTNPAWFSDATANVMNDYPSTTIATPIYYHNLLFRGRPLLTPTQTHLLIKGFHN
jgi:hypothetical protein